MNYRALFDIPYRIFKQKVCKTEEIAGSFQYCVNEKFCYSKITIFDVMKEEKS